MSSNYRCTFNFGLISLWKLWTLIPYTGCLKIEVTYPYDNELLLRQAQCTYLVWLDWILWHISHCRRCPWCNGYRRRIWTRRHEYKSWTWLTAFRIALITLGKVWIQLFSLQLWVNSRADLVLQPWWGN